MPVNVQLPRICNYDIIVLNFLYGIGFWDSFPSKQDLFLDEIIHTFD